MTGLRGPGRSGGKLPCPDCGGGRSPRRRGDGLL